MAFIVARSVSGGNVLFKATGLVITVQTQRPIDKARAAKDRSFVENKKVDSQLHLSETPAPSVWHFFFVWKRVTRLPAGKKFAFLSLTCRMKTTPAHHLVAWAEKCKQLWRGFVSHAANQLWCKLAQKILFQVESQWMKFVRSQRTNRCVMSIYESWSSSACDTCLAKLRQVAVIPRVFISFTANSFAFWWHSLVFLPVVSFFKTRRANQWKVVNYWARVCR